MLLLVVETIREVAALDITEDKVEGVKDVRVVMGDVRAEELLAAMLEPDPADAEYQSFKAELLWADGLWADAKPSRPVKRKS